MLLKTIEFSFDSFVFHGTVGVKANRSFYLAKNIKICYTYDSLYRVQTLRGTQENRPLVSVLINLHRILTLITLKKCIILLITL